MSTLILLFAGWRGFKQLGMRRRIALGAVFLAVFRDYSLVLAPGERGTVMCLAADRRQARTVLRYIRGFFDSVPAQVRFRDVARLLSPSGQECAEAVRTEEGLRDIQAVFRVPLSKGRGFPGDRKRAHPGRCHLER